MQVVATGPEYLDRPVLVEFAAAGRDGDFLFARQILPGEGCVLPENLGRFALSHHQPAMNAGPRPHVDNVIGGKNGFLVMLDHQHGVAEVTQAFQGLQQAVIITLMQPDGWFIQHIQNPGEAGADLRCQADTLGFATGKRAG